MNKLRFILTLSLLCSAMQAFAIFRDNILFTAQLDGAQVVPALTSNHKGVASFMLHRRRDTLSVNISTLGFIPASAGIYVGSPDQNGTLLIDLSDGIFGASVIKKISGAIIRSNVAKLMSDQLYIVISAAKPHHGATPAIRGQIKLAADWHFMADLKGASVVPAVTTTAFGLGSVALALDQQTLDYKIVCRNLSGPITKAALHIGAPGSNGDMAIDLSTAIKDNWVVGTLTAPDAAFLAQLLTGKAYVTISTAARPDGEVRAQLTQQRGFAMETFSDGTQMIPAINTKARSLGVFRLTPGMDSLMYDIVMDGLATSVDYMHLHVAYEGQAYTDLQVDLTNGISGARAKGIVRSPTLSSTSITRALISNLALITHTAAHPNGEIRGQLTRFTHEGYTFQLSGAQQVPATGSTAYGSGFLSLNYKGDRAYYSWLSGDLGSTPVSAAFHEGAIGQTGAERYNMSTEMTVEGNTATATGVWSSRSAQPLTAAIAAQIDQSKLYLHLTTTGQPSGEVRGQVRSGAVFFNSTSSVGPLFGAKGQFDMSLAPNPTTDVAQLVAPEIDAENLVVVVTDLYGRVVRTQTIGDINGSLNVALNLAAIPAGQYFVTLANHQHNTTRRLVKM